MFTLTILCDATDTTRLSFRTAHDRQVHVEGTVSELEASGLDVSEHWETDHETDHMTVTLDVSDADEDEPSDPLRVHVVGIDQSRDARGIHARLDSATPSDVSDALEYALESADRDGFTDLYLHASGASADIARALVQAESEESGRVLLVG